MDENIVMTVKKFTDMKRVSCNVCGLEFTPLNSKDRYTVDIGDGRTMDAFDCPQCGCQVRVNERYPRVDNNKARITYRRYDGALDF